MDLIAARLRLHKDDLYDLCEFNESWSEKSHYNFLTADWPVDKICFMNPPFSLGSAAIYKGLLEFQKGKNVVLLVKYTSALESAKIKTHSVLTLGCVESLPKPVAFVSNNNAKGTILDQNLVLIYLF